MKRDKRRRGVFVRGLSRSEQVVLSILV